MKNMKIIVVEDEVRARQGLVSIIQEMKGGHTVIAQASDGEKGYELVQKLKPDLVFTDVKMDRMSGIDMISRIREASNDVSVVIISAYEEFEYAKATVRYGVLEYITKPIVPEEIEYCVQKAQKHLHEKVEGDNEASFQDKSSAFLHPCVMKAIKIIETSYVTQLSQDETAKRLRLTPQYFSYLFKRDTGKSFTTYLRVYRIEIAKKLLGSNDMSVAEVAQYVGYPDGKYFCRIFKSETGVSPTQFIFSNALK